MTDSEHPRVTQSDHDALRDLADNGNESALDRLADLAEERDDIAELEELLGEGCELAGEYLAKRAASHRDLRELQRLADEGIERAETELEHLLK
jgi:phage tail tape-measure protein